MTDVFVLDQLDVTIVDHDDDSEALVVMLADVGLKGDPGPPGPPGKDGAAQIPEVLDGGFF